MRIVETKDGSVLDVFVKPKSREFKIAVESDEIIVCCTAEPVEGKVNKELVKELSRLFKKRVELVSGFTSKNKRVLVRGMGKSEVKTFLFPGRTLS